MQEPARVGPQSERAPGHFEALAPKVWPPAETLQLDGWLVCFADACTKRANSVHCVSGLPGAPLARVERCEQLYRERGQRVVFKLTDASLPDDLDSFLANRGYELIEATSVQLLSASPTRVIREETLDRVRIDASLSVGFSAACMQLNAVASELQQPLQGILKRIERVAEAAGFASVEVDGEVVAEGVAALVEGHACLCEIVTSPAHRRAGHAAAIVAALCRWADARGARPWLQVIVENARALPLYHSLGFREMYRHWYRVSA